MKGIEKLLLVLIVLLFCNAWESTLGPSAQEAHAVLTTQLSSQPVCYHFIDRTCVSVERRESQWRQDFIQLELERSDMASTFRMQRDGSRARTACAQMPVHSSCCLWSASSPRTVLIYSCVCFTSVYPHHRPPGRNCFFFSFQLQLKRGRLDGFRWFVQGRLFCKLSHDSELHALPHLALAFNISHEVCWVR